ncbi:histidine kinase dimerization/phospho-acceptor domain-containing protein [Vitiosangium sp. GDMCC 1.1324]|uniref:histidine kinase dimerization/phospho-acceptor domain-containing protein n=1 Tax=Vitiosangium sp. (strain GDMCC 1.1324) TaxID=2138576 RepID=UPI000D3B6112|nr:histidine kinase dimerization/phospho-acceptor domain-containing protein [Vitiosangium sp. GDMCC 1.1324]PTL85428.1 histidine kinase [Vitiosangium sp. GDMCC 1.1324]
MITSTAASSSVPSVREGADPVVDAARYGAVPTLMDSLLHDVRNPLNALSIHLEVLTEKLKGETGQVPPSQEKNLKAMREQIQRVDGILRRFAEFIVSRSGAPGEADLSETVTRAMDVLAHEGRKRRLQVRPVIVPGVRARLSDTGELGFLVVQTLMRAYGRSEQGAEVTVAVRAEDARAVLEVMDATGSAVESVPEAAALALRCAQLGVELHLRAGSCRLSFPLV